MKHATGRTESVGVGAWIRVCVDVCELGVGFWMGGSQGTKEEGKKEGKVKERKKEDKRSRSRKGKGSFGEGGRIASPPRVRYVKKTTRKRKGKCKRTKKN